jgi:hypothetical protein
MPAPVDDPAAMAEPVAAPATLPGLVALWERSPSTSVVDRATATFESLIAEQKAYGAGSGRRPAGRVPDRAVVREAHQRHVAAASDGGWPVSTAVVRDHPVGNLPAATQGASARLELQEERLSPLVQQQLSARADRGSAA